MANDNTFGLDQKDYETFVSFMLDYYKAGEKPTGSQEEYRAVQNIIARFQAAPVPDCTKNDVLRDLRQQATGEAQVVYGGNDRHYVEGLQLVEAWLGKRVWDENRPFSSAGVAAAAAMGD